MKHTKAKKLKRDFQKKIEGLLQENTFDMLKGSLALKKRKTANSKSRSTAAVYLLLIKKRN